MEGLLIDGTTGLLENLGYVVTQQIGKAWGVKYELEKLKNSLETIAAVTTEAEKRQGESEVVRLWLRRLKDVVYDADDVLDEFTYEARHQIEMDGEGSKVQDMSSSSNSFAFRLKMEPQIKDINDRLSILTETSWLSILEHDSLKTIDARTKITSILKLSYDKLPSHLKLCFSYCSLFPKDVEIDKITLIQLWMAEGFLHPSQDGNQLSQEDVGNHYFHSLLADSFFQIVKKDKLGDIETCKMPGLVHDLALSVNGVHDIKIVDSNDIESISEFRRLQLDLDAQTSKTFSKVLEKAKRVRSIVSIRNDRLGEHLHYSENLRVVCLLRCYALDIPSQLLKLKHLRYLDLTYCDFDEGHHVSIHQLYNLQTLVLRGCKNVETILKGIGSLKILRHLNIRHSDVEVLTDSIIKLTDLQTLDLYSCKHFVALPVNIGSLKNLGGLNIEWCEKLNVLPRDLGSLTRLRCLDLTGTDIKVLPESCISSLCNLEVMVFGDCKLPKEIKHWPKLRVLIHDRERGEMPIDTETLTCIETLESYMVRRNGEKTISYSSVSISGIEELANLNNLQVLKIVDLGNGIDAERAKLKEKINLRHLCLKWGTFFELYHMGFDEEAVLEGLEPHPNLRELEIYGFKGKRFPKWMSSSNCLPNLVKLNLSGYSGSDSLLSLGMLPCLEVLEICMAYYVEFLGEEFYYQQEEISSTTTISLFPSLIHLNVRDMETLKEWVVPIYNTFPSLEKLEIFNCPKLRSIPNSFPFLKKLYLMDNNSEAVAAILATGGLTSVTFLEIRESPQLLYIPLSLLSQNNTPNLQELVIHECSEFLGFVGDDYIFEVYNNSEKNGDDDNGYDDLEALVFFLSKMNLDSNSGNISNSLLSLQLIDCPNLWVLPDIWSFNSLRKLTIFKCDELKELITNYLEESFIFLQELKVDFIQKEFIQEDPTDSRKLVNLMEFVDQWKK
ncbi:putative disease resistance protein RGA4 [Papaver somniferum]|uniref:putative disease resistance protein RGA4 n=1 Tax=Papaver somniferum TaxID=3469 RepID=UPI000E6F8FEF|nr:putative disease resistance protein RGA4 [Papaver somniferum]